jgi:hypothetical protein
MTVPPAGEVRIDARGRRAEVGAEHAARGSERASPGFFAMPPSEQPSVTELQRRIDALLTESPEERSRSGFSDYVPRRDRLSQRLAQTAATASGAAGIAMALDECERLAAAEDRLAVQRALAIFLTHHPAVARLGLRVPSLAERAPWKAGPSRRHRAE